MNKLILNKVNKLKDKYFLVDIPREIGSKKQGIPVKVLDLKTKQYSEYISIAEAARFFNTHPKTIWRVVYFNKLYLNRYKITEKIEKELGVVDLVFIFYKNVFKYFYKILLVIKSNKTFIYRKFLFILILILVCIFMLFLIILINDIYHHYIFALQDSKVNYNRCIWEHKVLLNGVLNITENLYTKTGFNDLKLLTTQDIYNYEWITNNNTQYQLGIYQSIINEINLDFNIKGAEAFSGLNSSYSSPIIERVNINNIFSNALASSSNINDNANSLGIHGINYNRNSIIVDNGLNSTRIKTTELLNYQSNILYCLINGLSPSLY